MKLLWNQTLFNSIISFEVGKREKKKSAKEIRSYKRQLIIFPCTSVPFFLTSRPLLFHSDAPVNVHVDKYESSTRIRVGLWCAAENRVKCLRFIVPGCSFVNPSWLWGGEGLDECGGGGGMLLRWKIWAPQASGHSSVTHIRKAGERRSASLTESVTLLILLTYHSWAA